MRLHACLFRAAIWLCSRPVTPIDRQLLECDAPTVAPRLLNKVLAHGSTAGRIVEVEAYTPDDPASHSARGETRRNAAMFDRAGTLYCYVSYGIHVCANVAVDEVGVGAAVLIRALDPQRGLDVMRRRRSGRCCGLVPRWRRKRGRCVAWELFRRRVLLGCLGKRQSQRGRAVGQRSQARRSLLVCGRVLSKPSCSGLLSRRAVPHAGAWNECCSPVSRSGL